METVVLCPGDFRLRPPSEGPLSELSVWTATEVEKENDWTLVMTFQVQYFLWYTNVD